VNASKENAREAQAIISNLRGVTFNTDAERDFVYDFLEAAEKRLPTEASIARDKQRRRVNVQEEEDSHKHGGTSRP
jgi:hypothetical protein